MRIAPFLSAGSVEVLKLYCDRLSKESAVQGDVREGVKGNVRAEVGGVRDVRQNRVSPDSHHVVWHVQVLYFPLLTRFQKQKKNLAPRAQFSNMSCMIWAHYCDCWLLCS